MGSPLEVLNRLIKGDPNAPISMDKAIEMSTPIKGGMLQIPPQTSLYCSDNKRIYYGLGTMYISGKKDPHLLRLMTSDSKGGHQVIFNNPRRADLFIDCKAPPHAVDPTQTHMTLETYLKTHHPKDTVLPGGVVIAPKPIDFLYKDKNWVYFGVSAVFVNDSDFVSRLITDTEQFIFNIPIHASSLVLATAGARVAPS